LQRVHVINEQNAEADRRDKLLRSLALLLVKKKKQTNIGAVKQTLQNVSTASILMLSKDRSMITTEVTNTNRGIWSK